MEKWDGISIALLVLTLLTFAGIPALYGYASWRMARLGENAGRGTRSMHHWFGYGTRLIWYKVVGPIVILSGVCGVIAFAKFIGL